MKDLNQFIGKYKVEKTLRFELAPIGKTEAWMESKGVIANDKRRADNYTIVKSLIDRYHKVCIRESLTGCNLNWTRLSEAVETYRRCQDTESRKELIKAQKLIIQLQQKISEQSLALAQAEATKILLEDKEEQLKEKRNELDEKKIELDEAKQEISSQRARADAEKAKAEEAQREIDRLKNRGLLERILNK